MSNTTNVYTKGNVLVNKIKVGDIHYEYNTGLGAVIKVRVLTQPEKNGKYWKWKSRHIIEGTPDDSDKSFELDYTVHENYSHYSANLYDNEAYKGFQRM